MKRRIPAWLVLIIITVSSGLILGVTNAVTREPIADQALQAAESARFLVVPEAEEFRIIDSSADSVDWCYAGYRDGEIVGYACQVTRAGYIGEIEVIAGIGLDGRVSGVSVGGASFSETAGLGAKSKDAAFTSQFVGKSCPLSVVKSGGAEDTIDAITSATITSTAVTNAVNDISAYVASMEK